MKNKQAKITAIALSILIHIVFIGVSIGYKIHTIVPEEVKNRKFDIKLTDKTKFLPKKKQEIKKAQKPISQQSLDPISFMKSFVDEENIVEGKKKLSLPKDKFNELSKINTSDDLYKVKEKSPGYKTTRKVDKREVKSDVREVFSITYQDIVSDGEQQLDGIDQISEEFIDKMPGFTPGYVTDNFDITIRKDVDIEARGEVSVMRRKQQVGDLSQELVWMLETYRDPKTNSKYFKIRIRVNDEAKSLATIPKEIVFLLDASISIEDERLKEFGSGIEHSLKNLNEDDLFNLIIFKERTFAFKKKSVKASEKNIKKALNFMGVLRSGEKTDMFDVLDQMVKRKTQLNPSYIILLSDGRPTKGVTKAREIINKISDVNNGKKSIFAFSGGVRVNRYLLDFISYKNHGWTEYSYRTHRIGENLGKMYDKIDDPIIMNLRYLKSGVNEDEMFPRVLVDFFRNAELTLYGKYTDEQEFVMQLLGDVGEETKEFIVRSSFATATKGGKDIAKEWAYNKIYHLISTLRYNEDNESVLNEIHLLSKEFDLKTPYLNQILR